MRECREEGKEVRNNSSSSGSVLVTPQGVYISSRYKSFNYFTGTRDPTRQKMVTLGWAKHIDSWLIGTRKLTLLLPPPQPARGKPHTIRTHMLNCFSCVWLFATPWKVTCQALLAMGFSRQEYWNGLPCPSPGDLPYPGIETKSLVSPALAEGFFTTTATWETIPCTPLHKFWL